MKSGRGLAREVSRAAAVRELLRYGLAAVGAVLEKRRRQVRRLWGS
jgi:hypothetical protein